MKLLQINRTNTLSLFDRIMEWVVWFSAKYPGIWAQEKHRPGYKKRKSTVRHLSRVFKVKNKQPEPKEVLLSDNETKVTVPVFDFKESLKSLLTNPDVMKDENLIQNNFDKRTWRPTKRYEDMDPDDKIDDLNTGFLLENGIGLYCNGPVPSDCDIILPCGIIFFCDESHHDTKGGNKTCPVSFTIHILNTEARAQYENWVNIGFIPNKGVCKGKNANNFDHIWVEQFHKKRGKKTKTDKYVRVMNVKDQQLLYKAVLESFSDFCHKTGGLRIMWKGQRALVKPFSLLTISDTKEYNMMVNHFNSSGSRLIRCLCKDCMCSFIDLGTKIPPQCTRITLADTEHALSNEAYAQRLSQHQVRSSWNDIPNADNVEGHGGTCALEGLHVFGQGLYKDGIALIHDFIGPGTTKKSEKEQMDILFKALTSYMIRCSERSVPKFASRAGAMDLSRTTVMENEGGYYAIAICFCTHRGRELMKDVFMDVHGLGINDVVYTMTHLLAYDAWTTSHDMRKWELDNAEDAVAHFMQCLLDYLPQEIVDKDGSTTGSNGYHKVKFHALWLLLVYLRKYGSGRNFKGDHGECFHKISVKLNGDHTQKRNAMSSLQVAARDGDSNVINLAYSYVRHLCPPIVKHEYTRSLYVNDDEESDSDDEDATMEDDEVEERVRTQYKTRGKYTLVCPSAMGRLQEVDYKVVWSQKEKTVLEIPLNSHLLQVMSKWAIKQGYKQTYRCTGFTETKFILKSGNKVTYRARSTFTGPSGTTGLWSRIQHRRVPITLGRYLVLSGTTHQASQLTSLLRLMATLQNR